MRPTRKFKVEYIVDRVVAESFVLAETRKAKAITAARRFAVRKMPLDDRRKVVRLVNRANDTIVATWRGHYTGHVLRV